MTTCRYQLFIHFDGENRSVDIDKDILVLGRTHASDIVIDCNLMSRKHIEISVSKNQIWIKDLGSSNGTWINQRQLKPFQKVSFQLGDEILLGGKDGPHLTMKEADSLESTQVMVVGGPSLTVAKKKISPPPPKEIDKEKLSLIRTNHPSEPVSEEIRIQKLNVEKDIFGQIQQLINIESEQNRLKSLEEAKAIIKNAENSATKIIEDAVSEGQKKLKDVEKNLQEHQQKYLKHKNELERELQKLEQKNSELVESIRGLTSEEEDYRQTLSELEEKIKIAQQEIGKEYELLDARTSELNQLKINFEKEYENFKIEEKKAKSQLELDQLEAKLKVTQLQSEADQLKKSIESLNPEIHRLNVERDQVQESLFQIKNETNFKSRELDILNKEIDQLSESFKRLEEKHLDLSNDIEVKKQVLQTAQDEFNFLQEKSEQEFKEHSQKLESLQDEYSHLIKNYDATKEKQIKEIFDASEEIKRQKSFEVDALNDQIHKIKLEIEKSSKVAQEDYDRVLQFARGEARTIINEAKSESSLIQEKAQTLLKIAENDAKQIIKNSEDKVAISQKELEHEINAAREKAALEIATLDKKKDKIQNEIKLLDEQKISSIEETNKIIEKMINQTKGEARKIFQKAEQEAAEHTRNSLIELEESKKNLQLELEAIENEKATRILQTQSEVKSITDAANEKAKTIISESHLEAQKNKTKQENLLAELKHVEMAKIKEYRIKAEEDLRKRKTEMATDVATNVYALLTSEMYKARNKVLDDNFIESYTKEIKDLVRDTLLDKVSPDSEKLQQILKTAEDAKTKEKRYWRRLMIGGASAFALIVILVIFPDLISKPKGMVVSAFTEKKNDDADVFLQKVQEARKKIEVNLPTTIEFKASYTENVLYTTDYISKQQSKDYQDKWILDLNDFFIKELDVKDTTIIKFVSLEVALIRDLMDLRKKMEPQTIESIKDQMFEKEAEFKQKLSVLFENPDKVSQYYAYTERFWNELYRLRKPAN